MRRLATLTAVLVLAAAAPTTAQEGDPEDLCLRVTVGPGAMVNGPLAVSTGIKNGLIEITEVVPCAVPLAEEDPEPTSEPSPLTTFGDGWYIVGEEVRPGAYRTRTTDEYCYWARYKDFNDGLSDTPSD
jgi:hypothetical protein